MTPRKIRDQEGFEEPLLALGIDSNAMMLG
jgi:hypothetical protein